MADNLFVAITTDTGSFQYPSTTARTYEIGAELIRAGVNVGELSQKMYESYPRRRLELLRALLERAALHQRRQRRELRPAARDRRAKLGAQPEDNEGPHRLHPRRARRHRRRVLRGDGRRARPHQPALERPARRRLPRSAGSSAAAATSWPPARG